MSDEIKRMKPTWIKFITDLGYTKEQGELFADGYANHLSTLPIMEKLNAIAYQHDKCMTAGFKNANIDEKEAWKLAHK